MLIPSSLSLLSSLFEAVSLPSLRTYARAYYCVLIVVMRPLVQHSLPHLPSLLYFVYRRGLLRSTWDLILRGSALPSVRGPWPRHSSVHYNALYRLPRSLGAARIHGFCGMPPMNRRLPIDMIVHSHIVRSPWPFVPTAPSVYSALGLIARRLAWVILFGSGILSGFQDRFLSLFLTSDLSFPSSRLLSTLL